jgi:hypothetical protein
LSAARAEGPFFSVCIPQYNRTSFLLKACESLAAQSFRSFEVCLSDDCSTDGREGEILRFLDRSGLAYRYERQRVNVRYDANLRSSLALARGRYSFLLGNDDALSSPDVLAQLHADMTSAGDVHVVLSNFEDHDTGEITRRIASEGILGAGPDAAIRHFRSFAFLSGVVLDSARAQALATAAWDGSEMYQMHLGCRLLAEGGVLLGITRATVRKDVRVPKEAVDSYALPPRDAALARRSATETTVARIPALVAAAVLPHVARREHDRCSRQIATQVLLFPYGYWIFEYRRVQSWRHAAAFCVGMRPRRSLAGLPLGPASRVLLTLLYGAATGCGLLLPVRLFTLLRRHLYRAAKAWRWR